LINTVEHVMFSPPPIEEYLTFSTFNTEEYSEYFLLKQDNWQREIKQNREIKQKSWTVEFLTCICFTSNNVR